MTAPRAPSAGKRTRKPLPGGKKRRAYTMSAAAKAQRRAAQPAAALASLDNKTGPTTDAGKAASSRNAWKHGARSAVHRKSFALGAASMSKLFGKPCVTTCPHHPDNATRTSAPCSLVVEQLTHTGGDCLDKTVYLHAFDMMMAAITEGDMDGMSGLLASQQAANFEMLQGLRSEIARNGWVLTIPAVDKDGDVVYDNEGRMVPAKFVPNPGIMPYIMLLEKMNFSLPEMMLTPKARNGAKTDEENAGSLQSFMATLAQRATAALPRRIDHDA